ncbi:MAG: adenosylcobinamide-GDP ribazoletransferase [Hydrogenophaga sp.]|uniref:adenosylcobinamide-GDP ribazoletransferase n=1 Tax=Hydrogenophaga sp. TaxID=1904254 RepID=UPI003D151C71
MSLFVRHFLLALQFFTRIPVTGALADWVGFSPAMLRASAAHFPGVGWIVGGLSALLFCALQWALPTVPAAAWVAAIVSTVFSVMLTGAFHEDGLADLADGLGGSAQRERALEIMKDSRIGSFGAIALVLVLLAKISLLALLAQSSATLAALAMFAAHVTSRTTPLLVIRTLPHVGDTPQSKSKPLAEYIGNGALMAGLLWWTLAMALVFWWWPAVGLWAQAVLGAALGLAWMWRLLRRRLQGFTGDGLGATQQLSEVMFYLGVALALPATP